MATGLKSNWPRAARAVLVAAIVLAAAVLTMRIGGVETGLLALVDSSVSPDVRAMADSAADRARVMLEGPSWTEVLVGVRAVNAAFGVNEVSPAGKDIFADLRGRTDGLLSNEARSLIASGDTSAVREMSEARLFGIAPPLFPVKDDPMLLATSYVEGMDGNFVPGWSFRDGLPTTSAGGREIALVTLSLSGRSPRAVADAMNGLLRNLPPGVKAYFSGAAFHAARSASRAEREIAVLSAISLALVLALGWLLFRSASFVLPLAGALCMGGVVATAALFVVWERPHVLTFVFGTSLIGLSVDYVYHARAAGGAKAVIRPLTQSFTTTIACFAPLLFAGTDVLRQMALFTMAGLVAVYGAVTIFAWNVPGGRSAGSVEEKGGITGENEGVGRGGLGSGLARLLRIALFLVAASGMFFVKTTTDPSAFYKPDGLLAAGEKMVAERLGKGTGNVVFARGATLQEALEREEAAGVPHGLSRIIPSLRRQRENAALAARLYEAEGVEYASHTGMPKPKARSAPRLFDPAELGPESPLGNLVGTMWTGRGIVSPCPKDFAPASPGVAVVDMRAGVESMFAAAMSSSLRLFGVSALALAAFLVIAFRRRALAFAAPIVMALAATVGVMGWLGVPFTFFTMLGVFVLTGLGLDYAIFHRGCSDRARRTVLFAFLTSLAGFGLLAFTSFPVTRDMGITFTAGLFFAYLFSFPLSSSKSVFHAASGRDGPRKWYEQSEQSAGRWRLMIMWLAYSWLGKGFLKVLCVPVMAFIYPFARPAKAALREYYSVLAAFRGRRGESARAASPPLFRHLLGFAWSLADKTDACSLGKSLPRMSVRGDASSRSLLSCISANKGVFLVTSHVGTAEMLLALPRAMPGLPSPPHVHAFQQMAQSAVFTDFLMRRLAASSLTIHAVEEIGVETAVEMQAALARGEMVIMAGDRVSAGSARCLDREFLGVECRWPKGVFAFARLMEAPVFFATCVRTGWNAYEVHFSAAPEKAREEEMLAAYASFLEEEVLAHPIEWHQFYQFFADCGKNLSRPEIVPAVLFTFLLSFMV